MSATQFTLLGTGDAAGFPLYGCHCPYCSAARKQTKKPSHLDWTKFAVRKPTSALLTVSSQHILLDAGLTDLTTRFANTPLSAILLTHFHPDHVQGLFHLRWGVGAIIPVYCPPDKQGCADLFKHSGILDFRPLKAGQVYQLDEQTGELSSIPQAQTNNRSMSPFDHPILSNRGIKVLPVTLTHSKLTFGYVFKLAHCHIAYLTDTKGISEQSRQLILNFLQGQSLDYLVVDTSHPDPHTPQPKTKRTDNHNTLADALAMRQQLNAKQTVLTHIGHDLHCQLVAGKPSLPSDILMGFDGMQLFS